MGRLGADVRAVKGGIRVGDHTIRVLSERNPADLPWGDLGVDVVVESTGIFTDRAKAAMHLEGGAPLVIVSAPSNGADLTIERLASIDPALTILEDAYRSVSSERDQQAAWLFRVQKVNGDPSPAHTVADEFGISPAYARKIHERHFARVRAAVLEEDRYRPLRALPWFAA